MFLKIAALVMAGIGLAIAGGFEGETAFTAMAMPFTVAIAYLLLDSA